MSWSNLNPYLVYICLGALAFFTLVAYIATREYEPFSSNDIKKYASTFNIKSTLLAHLTTWISDQPGESIEISKSLGISTEMLEVIIMGRADLISVDELIKLLVESGHQVDVIVNKCDSENNL
jgi:predicted XRE-type DNA-binding protein